MSSLNDKVAMRHMDVYMEQEEKYTEAVMSDSERIVNKLHFEMASRVPFELSTPPLRWGPWFVHLLVDQYCLLVLQNVLDFICFVIVLFVFG